jgi:hypothetical protein
MQHQDQILEAGLAGALRAHEAGCDLGEQLRLDAARRFGVKPDGAVAVRGLSGDIHAHLRRWQTGIALIREESLRPDETSLRHGLATVVGCPARAPERGAANGGGPSAMA